MVIDQLGFINNLFYPTGEAREDTAASAIISEAEKQGNANPLPFKYYTLTPTMRRILMIPLAMWYLLWQFSPLIPLVC